MERQQRHMGQSVNRYTYIRSRRRSRGRIVPSMCHPEFGTRMCWDRCPSASHRRPDTRRQQVAGRSSALQAIDKKIDIMRIDMAARAWSTGRLLCRSILRGRYLRYMKHRMKLYEFSWSAKSDPTEFEISVRTVWTHYNNNDYKKHDWVPHELPEEKKRLND